MLKKLMLTFSVLLSAASMSLIGAGAAQAATTPPPPSFPYQFENGYTGQCLTAFASDEPVTGTDTEACDSAVPEQDWAVDYCTEDGADFYGCEVVNEFTGGCLTPANNPLNAEYPVATEVGSTCATWNIFPGEGAHVLQWVQDTSRCLDATKTTSVRMSVCGINNGGVPEEGWHWLG